MTTTTATASAPISTKTKWDILAGIVVIHAVALLAPFTFTWRGFWAFFWLQWITGLFGITLGYHRLITHRSFTAPKWLEYLLAICGALALQGGPIKWVSTHRVHHAFSDRPGDPHSPTRGFWWAHIGWLFAWDDLTDEPAQYERFVPDLMRDPVYPWIEKNTVWFSVLLGVVLYTWGGLSALVWGVFFRTVFVYHATWLVNSAAHLWGYQSYDTNEGSRNNWWVALLSYGEGWHNNHHAYLHSAAHGLRWWEFDITYLTIRFLSLAQLATGVRLPQGNPAKLPAVKPLIAPRLPIPVPSLSI